MRQILTIFNLTAIYGQMVISEIER